VVLRVGFAFAALAEFANAVLVGARESRHAAKQTRKRKTKQSNRHKNFCKTIETHGPNAQMMIGDCAHFRGEHHGHDMTFTRGKKGPQGHFQKVEGEEKNHYQVCKEIIHDLYLQEQGVKRGKQTVHLKDPNKAEAVDHLKAAYKKCVVDTAEGGPNPHCLEQKGKAERRECLKCDFVDAWMKHEKFSAKEDKDAIFEEVQGQCGGGASGGGEADEPSEGASDEGSETESEGDA